MPKPKTSPRAQTAALKQLNAELSELRETLAERERELAAHRTQTGNHEAEVEAMRQKLATAKAALLPFHAKTKEWRSEEWPPLQVSMARSLTWGDLKQAAEAAVALG